jgi:hypothetical protein
MVEYENEDGANDRTEKKKRTAPRIYIYTGRREKGKKEQQWWRCNKVT